MAFINHDLISRITGFAASVNNVFILALSSSSFPKQYSLSSQGLGQKTKQDLLKEESEKMKVFAQQLRSKPQFIAVFKVGNIRIHNIWVTFLSFSGFFQLPLADVHDCCLDHGSWDGTHLHLPLLALAGENHIPLLYFCQFTFFWIIWRQNQSFVNIYCFN